MPRDRRQKFVTLAENRVKRVINDFRLIGNLADKSNYEYSGDQVDKIVSVLDKEISNVETLFMNGGSTELFTLE